MTVGGILIQMNNSGNPNTLVPAHPGNTNAAKSGAYSDRLIAPRAAEIVAEFNRSFEFSIVQRVVVAEVARSIAILEAIDRDLDERGVVDKRGEPRSILNYRSRIVRQLDRSLSKIAPSIERQTAENDTSLQPGRSDYIAELQRIALGRDTTATARDRVSALKELLALDSETSSGVTVVNLSIPEDRLPERLRRRRDADLAQPSPES